MVEYIDPFGADYDLGSLPNALAAVNECITRGWDIGTLPRPGVQYYDSTLGTKRYWDGTIWVNYPAAGVAGTTSRGKISILPRGAWNDNAKYKNLGNIWTAIAGGGVQKGLFSFHIPTDCDSITAITAVMICTSGSGGTLGVQCDWGADGDLITTNQISGVIAAPMLNARFDFTDITPVFGGTLPEADDWGQILVYMSVGTYAWYAASLLIEFTVL